MIITKKWFSKWWVEWCILNFLVWRLRIRSTTASRHGTSIICCKPLGNYVWKQAWSRTRACTQASSRYDARRCVAQKFSSPSCSNNGNLSPLYRVSSRIWNGKSALTLQRLWPMACSFPEDMAHCQYFHFCHAITSSSARKSPKGNRFCGWSKSPTGPQWLWVFALLAMCGQRSDEVSVKSSQ